MRTHCLCPVQARSTRRPRRQSPIAQLDTDTESQHLSGIITHAKSKPCIRWRRGLDSTPWAKSLKTGKAIFRAITVHRCAFKLRPQSCGSRFFMNTGHKRSITQGIVGLNLDDCPPTNPPRFHPWDCHPPHTRTALWFCHCPSVRIAAPRDFLAAHATLKSAQLPETHSLI